MKKWFLFILSTLLWTGCVHIFPSVEIEHNTIGMELILVEAGHFMMGSADGDSHEKPVHRVEITKDYYMGRGEVTQGEWQRIMGYNPSYFEGEQLPEEYNQKIRKRLPVECVSWYEAVAFCNRLSEIEGLNPCYAGEGEDITCNFAANGYRLPTEAEWEYAARGGREALDTVYSGADDIDKLAVFNRNGERSLPLPVDSKTPNEIGLYNMSGNVREWCWDWYDSEYYRRSPAKDPVGPESGFNRVIRGGSGSIMDTSWNCRVSSKGRQYPPLYEKDPVRNRKTDYTQGFRIVRVP